MNIAFILDKRKAKKGKKEPKNPIKRLKIYDES